MQGRGDTFHNIITQLNSVNNATIADTCHCHNEPLTSQVC